MRAAGIGYGSRKTSNSKEVTPGPNRYTTDISTIEDEKKKNKGWTMGVSREV